MDAGIVYTVHMQTFGWQEAKMDGIVAGYTKQEKSVEAVRIQLGAYVPKGNVRYAVETAQGQSAWRKDGEQAGSVGQKEPLLGIGSISQAESQIPMIFCTAFMCRHRAGRTGKKWHVYWRRYDTGIAGKTCKKGGIGTCKTIKTCYNI